MSGLGAAAKAGSARVEKQKMRSAVFMMRETGRLAFSTPDGVSSGVHDHRAGRAIGVFAVMSTVDTGVEEVPLAGMVDQSTRRIDAVRIGLLLVASGQPGAAVGALPGRAAGRKAPFEVHGLGLAAVVPQHADAAFWSKGDGQVIKLLIGGVGVVTLDDAPAVLEVQAVRGGVAINDAEQTWGVVVGAIGRIALGDWHQGCAVHLEG